MASGALPCVAVVAGDHDDVVSVGAILVPASMFANGKMALGAAVEFTTEAGRRMLGPAHPIPLSSTTSPVDEVIVLSSVPSPGHHCLPGRNAQRMPGVLRALPRLSAAFHVDVVIPDHEFELLSASILRSALHRQDVVVEPGSTLSLVLWRGRPPVPCRIQSCKPSASPVILTSSTNIVLCREPPVMHPIQTGAVFERVEALGDAFPRLVSLLSLDPRWRPRGVIVHGPSGSGKTLLVDSALCQLGQTQVARLDGRALSAMATPGAAERALVSVFDHVGLDGVIVIDAIDAIGGRDRDRRRLLGQLLVCMDQGATASGSIVIGVAANVDSLDLALRRPGRFDYEIGVTAGDVAQRSAVLSLYLPKVGADAIEMCASKAVGYTGSDLRQVADLCALSHASLVLICGL